MPIDFTNTNESKEDQEYFQKKYDDLTEQIVTYISKLGNLFVENPKDILALHTAVLGAYLHLSMQILEMLYTDKREKAVQRMISQTDSSLKETLRRYMADQSKEEDE